MTDSTSSLDEFSAILQELQAMHDKKSKDYGTNQDPYANVVASVEFGVEPWIGALIRENDKTTRIKSFIAKASLANESLEDSLIDKAVYSIIALLLYRRTKVGTPDLNWVSTIPSDLGHKWNNTTDRCDICGYTGDAWEIVGPAECVLRDSFGNRVATETLTEPGTYGTQADFAFTHLAGQHKRLGYFHEKNYKSLALSLNRPNLDFLNERLVYEKFNILVELATAPITFEAYLKHIDVPE